MIACQFFLCLLAMGPGESSLKPGDHIWVGYGMAKGYDLPFGKKLTIKKVRVLLMQEARIVFSEYPRRFYLRNDFGNDYAFRQDPTTLGFNKEQWAAIRAGKIEEGMRKDVFLCIRPLSQEVSYSDHNEGRIEQWIYRAEPTALFGDRQQNPPTAIYFFQNEVLIDQL